MALNLRQKYLSSSYQTPHDASILGFKVLEPTMGWEKTLIKRDKDWKKRKDYKDAYSIPFQYIEKIPSWSKTANYNEVSSIMGRYEGIDIYSNSTNNDFSLNLIYYAEGSEKLNETLKKNIIDETEKDKVVDQPIYGNIYKVIKDDAPIINAGIYLKTYTNMNDAVDAIIKAYGKVYNEANRMFFKIPGNGYINIEWGITGTKKIILDKNRLDALKRDRLSSAFQYTYWTIERINMIVRRLKSFTYPQYDGEYGPPKKLLLNIGNVYQSVPVIIKSVTVDDEGPYLENFDSFTRKVGLEMRSEYPLWQAISQGEIYVYRKDDNKLFAHKKMNSNTLRKSLR